MKQVSKRNVSLDCLRILAMFLVIVSHYIFHGLKTNELHVYYDVTSMYGCANYILIELLYIISCTAVNCYIMITGYFLIERCTYRWNGIVKTVTTTLFYSITFLLLYMLLHRDFSISMVKDSFFPIYSQSYWFVTSYIGLMLIAPFLSRIALTLNKKQYRTLIVVLFVLSFEYLYGRVYAGVRSLLFFSFLFLIAGYIKLYGVPFKWVKNKGMIMIVLWSLYFVMATAINLIFCLPTQYTLRSTSNDSMTLFLSLAVFVYFLCTNIPLKLESLILKIVPYCFGVYLLHDNPLFRRDLWTLIIPDHYIVPVAIQCLITCGLIFCIGIVFDFLRQKLFCCLKVNRLENYIASKLPDL